MHDPLALRRTVPQARRAAWWLQRWLGFIFVTVFYGLWRQMPGLTGPNGILPAADFLGAVRENFGWLQRLWFAPSLLWLGSGSFAVHLLCGAGLAAALLLLLDFLPRPALAVCLGCFLSFLATAQAFASYQSDGMLMSAALFGLFLDPERPSWWSWFSLRWLWFTIYFGSGVAKLASGDPEWRHLTALDHYYENGPLPTWIGWYAQQYTPHWANAVTAGAVLVLELGICWLCFAPRRFRLGCFWIGTAFQIAIIVTSNYGFLNWLVLGLGLALVDDRHLESFLHLRWRWRWRWPAARDWSEGKAAPVWASVLLAALVLITGDNLAARVWPRVPAPTGLDTALQPFRIADPFGLFAVMTRNRYELEFQGSSDGVHWVAYPFRYKPQDPGRAPGLDGPYQPRFDWNLWFASLDEYQNNTWVVQTELRLLQNDGDVLHLFAGNPFSAAAPRAVRTVRWQYWFASRAEHRTQHVWWTRRMLGLYAPELAMTPSGAQVVEQP